MIVDVLTKQQLLTLYRFYGARHSVVSLGNKINFEIEQNAGFMPRMKDLMHLGYDWLLDRNRLYIWQQFTKQFYSHLKETTNLDSFYFDLLEQSATSFSKQNPKRVVLQNYLKLLEYEGRLHLDTRCYICGQPLHQKISLMQAFLPAHPECVFGNSYDSLQIRQLMQSMKSLHLSDREVESLYEIVIKGF